MTDILVVEDNLEMAALLCDFLEAEGYSVKQCADGESALTAFQSEGARLVILDIMLPGLDGFAVCRKIRKNANTPIIIVSAKDEKDDKLNGLILGADDYIEKVNTISLENDVAGYWGCPFDDRDIITVSNGSFTIDATFPIWYNGTYKITVYADGYQNYVKNDLVITGFHEPPEIREYPTDINDGICYPPQKKLCKDSAFFGLYEPNNHNLTLFSHKAIFNQLHTTKWKTYNFLRNACSNSSHASTTSQDHLKGKRK